MSHATRAALLAALVCGLAASPARVAHAVCGDGIFEPEVEQCDDGNTTRGDGCDHLCQVRLCLQPPAAGCIPAQAATLRLKQRGKDDKVKAKLDLEMWNFTEDFSAGALGDPVFGRTRYDVCIYDENEVLTGFLVVNRGFALCGKKGKACWQPLGEDGFRYVDPEAWASGVSSIEVVHGTDGAGRVRVVAKRTPKRKALPLMNQALSDDDTLEVRVMSSDGGCVGAELLDVERTETDLRAQ